MKQCFVLDHCCPLSFVAFILAMVLSVLLRITASDYPLVSFVAFILAMVLSVLH
jgi:hypothetical protein